MDHMGNSGRRQGGTIQRSKGHMKKGSSGEKIMSSAGDVLISRCQ